VTQTRWSKDLEKENAWLRKAVSSLTLDASILKEVIEEKYWPPRDAVLASAMPVRRSVYPSGVSSVRVSANIRSQVLPPRHVA